MRQKNRYRSFLYAKEYWYACPVRYVAVILRGNQKRKLSLNGTAGNVLPAKPGKEPIQWAIEDGGKTREVFV